MANPHGVDVPQVIAAPTWLGERGVTPGIKDFFGPADKACMGPRGVDLNSYDVVSRDTRGIHQHITTKSMPKGAPWSDTKIQSYTNWVNAGFPRGDGRVPTDPGNGGGDVPIPEDHIVRKDISKISDGEKDLLVKAFRGLQSRPPEQDWPEPSWQKLAKIHTDYCLHHLYQYNPWHRIYLIQFEQALRTVDGCEKVTLPYWNFLEEKEYPEWLDDPALPFKSGPMGAERTERNLRAEVLRGYVDFAIKTWGETAIEQTTYEAFNGLMPARTNIIGCHDRGHVELGRTLSDQSRAAYDPVFWFFHCNHDRIWWKWQQLHGAETLADFTANLGGNTDWFSLPENNELRPFINENTGQLIRCPNTINLTKWCIAYLHPGEENFGTKASPQRMKIARRGERFGNAPAIKGASVPAVLDSASVQVKGVNRLNIPGPFRVLLFANDELLDELAFFQPRNPRTCDNCTKNEKVNFLFNVPIASILGKTLTAKVKLRKFAADAPEDEEIAAVPQRLRKQQPQSQQTRDAPYHSHIDQDICLHACGNPTINVRIAV